MVYLFTNKRAIATQKGLDPFCLDLAPLVYSIIGLLLHVYEKLPIAFKLLTVCGLVVKRAETLNVGTHCCGSSRARHM